ncbi:hypothetical protein VTN96DRAFT_947 [Rasamsonia emersonii]
MARFRLDRPLAKLDPSRVPVVPIRPVRVRLDADDQPYRQSVHVVGQPVGRRLQRLSVDIRVDPPAGQQNQIPEEVRLEDGQGQRFERLDHLRNPPVQIPDQMLCDVVRHHLVDESGMEFRPAGLEGPQFLIEVARCRGVFPCLPDVGGELALDVVGKLVAQSFSQGPIGERL